MTRVCLIAAAKTVDDSGSLQHCIQLESKLHNRGITIRELTIDPLSTPWHSELKPFHFRSGCGPLEAVQLARKLIRNGEAAAVVISGKDPIRTGYKRQERLDLMAIYGEDYPLTTAYNDLAQQFIHRHGADAEQFHQLAHHLFENYKCSYRNVVSDQLSAEQLPDERWYQHITPLFRGVDCANPILDFCGRVLITSEELAEQLSIPTTERLEIAGVGLGFLADDGKQHIDEIASYEHLVSAYQQACDDADIDFATAFRAGDALLETYTCYPVVPIAFLLASGLVDMLEQIPAFLEQHLITITGGMNLGKGAWNNPALNSLIEMHHQLCASESHHIGAIHGNGGLGYKQGVVLLKKI